MNNNLVCCLFVLDTIKNDNIRKNNIKKIKILLSKDKSLPKIPFNGKHMKGALKNYVSKIIGSDEIHMEQVFAINYKNDVDIIYLGLTNIEYIKKIEGEYELFDFEIKGNSKIVLDEKAYPYITKEVVNRKKY